MNIVCIFNKHIIEYKIKGFPMSSNASLHAAIDRLQSVIDCLIDPETGCPWDKEQTPLSLTEYVVEECHELVDAIRSGSVAHTREELGDVAFLFFFLAQLYKRDNEQNLLEQAIDDVTAKMIRRHPHIFADTKISSQDELFANWEQIKREEKAKKNEKDSLFSGLPTSLPPLTKAYRLHSKAARVGFTWPEDEEVERQVEAEWLELLDASVAGEQEAIEHEFGDHLFTLVELGRRKGIKASVALDAASRRFLARFEAMETLAKERGLDFNTLSLDEKDELWEEIKKTAVI